MKKTFVLLSSIIALASCTKSKEFALNEKVSKEFLKEMNSLDSLEIKYFSDSSFIKKTPSAENSIEVKDAVKLSENSKAGITNISGIKVSQEAMSFYTAVLDYLGDTKAQGDLARDFFQESDPQMREGYYEKLRQDFKKLKNKPDSILTIQKTYLDKVGIK